VILEGEDRPAGFTYLVTVRVVWINCNKRKSQIIKRSSVEMSTVCKNVTLIGGGGKFWGGVGGGVEGEEAF
jgi:hypothetical protein